MSTRYYWGLGAPALGLDPQTPIIWLGEQASMCGDDEGERMTKEKEEGGFCFWLLLLYGCSSSAGSDFGDYIFGCFSI